MRIMFLLFSFTIGGTERLVVDLCNEMVVQNQDVYLYIVNDFFSENLLRELDSNVHVELQRRKIEGGEKIGTLIRVTKYIKKNNIEVVHCNSLNAPELLVLKQLMFCKTKIIHTIHGVGQYSYLPKWKVALRNRLCDSFIAISNSVKKDMINSGATSQKVQVVYNAIDLKKFQNIFHKTFDKEHVVIGNVARMMPEKKGQDILISAMDQLRKNYPGIICKFAGGYDAQHESAYETLRCEVKKRNLDRNIIFCGNIEDVPTFLRNVDIFVLPSRSEGFGISLIEAMSMEIPCIASNLDGPAEIIGNNEWGELFQVDNVGELTAKVEYVIEHYDEYLEKQEDIRRYICENFDIRRMCKKLLNIYMREK